MVMPTLKTIFQLQCLSGNMSRLNYKQKNQEKTIFPVYFFPQLYLYGHSTTHPFLCLEEIKKKNTSSRLV